MLSVPIQSLTAASNRCSCCAQPATFNCAQLPHCRFHTLKQFAQPRHTVACDITLPRSNLTPDSNVSDPDWEFVYPFSYSDFDQPASAVFDLQEPILGGEPPVMTHLDDYQPRAQRWTCNNKEYYQYLEVTLTGAGMEETPIHMGTIYWKVWRSTLGRGKFQTQFVPNGSWSYS